MKFKELLNENLRDDLIGDLSSITTNIFILLKNKRGVYSMNNRGNEYIYLLKPQTNEIRLQEFVLNTKTNTVKESKNVIWRCKIKDFKEKFKKDSDAQKFEKELYEFLNNKNVSNAFDLINDFYENF